MSAGQAGARAAPAPARRPRSMTLDSAVGSGWTLVSRASGLVRLVAVAAVLGPTQLGDLYQASNALPNLTFELLTGALFGSLVVPALVRHLDAGESGAASRLASGFLSLAVLASGCVVALGVLAGPLVLGVLTAGVEPGAPRVALGPSWVLLSLLLLQVPLYAVAGMGAAVQNARGRFALAAAAPTVENLGILAALAGFAALRPPDGGGAVGTWEVLVLGGGTTAAVALHAGAQCWGAHRAGVPLRLGRPRRDPAVTALVRLAVPALGYSGLNVVRYLCVLVVAAAVPGGVVAVTLALAFYNLPVALVARPVAQAALPRLARAAQQGDGGGYDAALHRALSLVLLVTVPAAVGYGLLSGALAQVVAFGAMDAAQGRELVRAALLGVSAGVVGEAVLVLCTQAAYARGDAIRPLRAVALRTVLAVPGMLAALALLDGAALLGAVGLVLAASDLVAAAWLAAALRRAVPARASRLVPELARTGVASAVMVPAVMVVANALGPGRGQVGASLVVVAAGLAGALVYVAVQRALRSPLLTAREPATAAEEP